MELFETAGRRYARFPRLARESGLIHAFATRPLDVAARTGPRQAERAARRRQMAADLGFEPERLCYCVQVHEARIAIADSAQPAGAFDGCDAIITALPSKPLMTFSADCPLVLLYDPRRRVLALAHASWRCTVGRIVRNLVELLRMGFGVAPAGLLAGVGPGAGPCCYEVREDVHAAAAGLPECDTFFPRRDGRLFFDLWSANQAQLVEAGLPPENIELAGVCTICRNDLFYSFRREGPGCGHFGLMAGMSER